jgi:hypothetical protein
VIQNLVCAELLYIVRCLKMKRLTIGEWGTIPAKYGRLRALQFLILWSIRYSIVGRKMLYRSAAYSCSSKSVLKVVCNEYSSSNPSFFKFCT